MDSDKNGKGYIDEKDTTQEEPEEKHNRTPDRLTPSPKPEIQNTVNEKLDKGNDPLKHAVELLKRPDFVPEINGKSSLANEKSPDGKPNVTLLLPFENGDTLPAKRKTSALSKPESLEADLASLYGGDDKSRADSQKADVGLVPNFVDLVKGEVEKKEKAFRKWKKAMKKTNHVLKTNALYESTELGGFKYLTMTDFSCELLFWYVLLGVFVVICVFHIIETLNDFAEEEIKTNQLLGSTINSDYENIRNWTLCYENYFGGARPNEPAFDSLFVAKLANSKVSDAPDAAANIDQGTIFFFIQLINNALYVRSQNTDDPQISIKDAFLSLIRQYYPNQDQFGYGFMHSLILRKHLQQLYQQEMPNAAYGRKSMARYHFSEFTDDFAKVQGFGDDHSATLLNPGGFLINQMNFDLMGPTSLYKTRLAELQAILDANDTELSFPALQKFNYTELLSLQTKEVSRNATDAFYNAISINANKRALLNYLKEPENGFSTTQKVQAIDQIRQLAMADIQKSPEYAAQKEIYAAEMAKAKEMYQIFNGLMSQYGISAAVPAKTLAEVYVALFIEPTLDIYTEPVQKRKDVKISLRFMDETLECFNIELPEDAQLKRVQTNVATFLALLGDGEAVLFDDPEFIAKYRHYYTKRFASWWIEPAIFEPVTTPSLRLYFNEDSSLHWKVENKFELLNTSHSECADDGADAVIAFDCLTECRKQFIKRNLNCTPNLYRSQEEIDNPNVTMCTPADYLSEKFRLTQIQYFDSLGKEVFLNRTTGKSLNENSTLAQCQNECKSIPKCEYTSFSGHVTSQPSAAGSEDSELGDVFATVGNVNFFYKTAVMYFHIEQQYTFSWFIWVANVGGVLEFWVGAGLMSIIHTVIWLGKQAVYKYRGTANQPVEDEDEDDED